MEISQISKTNKFLLISLLILSNNPLFAAGTSVAGGALRNLLRSIHPKNISHLNQQLPVPNSEIFLPKSGSDYATSLRDEAQISLKRELDEGQQTAIEEVTSSLMHSQTNLNARTLLGQARVLQDAGLTNKEIQTLGELMLRPRGYYSRPSREHRRRVVGERFYPGLLFVESESSIGRMGPMGHNNEVAAEFLKPSNPNTLVRRRISPSGRCSLPPDGYQFGGINSHPRLPVLGGKFPPMVTSFGR